MIYNPLPGAPGKDFRLTQGFGQRPEYYAKYGLLGHNGYDLAPVQPNLPGVVVYAPHEGYANFYQEATGYGNHIEIVSLAYDKDGNRRMSVLGHLASFLIKNGQFVNAGDPVGIMGATGDATGVHLHFTYKRLDQDGNPLDLKNGYKGAVAVGPYVRLWLPQTLTAA